MFPDKDEYNRTDKGNRKASDSSGFSFDSTDHKEANRIRNELGNADNHSIDIKAEIELIKHESRCVELEDNCALKNDKHKGHESKRFIFK